MSTERAAKLQRFADLLEYHHKRGLVANGYTLENHNTTVAVHEGKRWARVDVGGSGRYMVDRDGSIVGIKAYGVPHLGHRYGTLDTVSEWYWGGYSAHRWVTESWCPGCALLWTRSGNYSEHITGHVAAGTCDRCDRQTNELAIIRR